MNIIYTSWFNTTHIIALSIVPIALILFLFLGYLGFQKMNADKLTDKNTKEKWGFWRKVWPYCLITFACFFLIVLIAFVRQLWA